MPKILYLEIRVIDMQRIGNPSNDGRPKPQYRIIVADDSSVIRTILATELINNNFVVAGQASSGIETLHLAQTREPSLVLLDLDMPLMEGLSTLRQLQKVHPHLPVLVYSMLNASVYSYRCMRLGARGFISKNDGASLIISAIPSVLQGQMLFPSQSMAVDSNDLSDGEIVALRCLVRGGGIDSIASALMISSVHAAELNQRLNTKLGMSTHQELVRYGKSLTLS
ncbi:response regulator transcription factor [Pseudomonas sp. ITA]|uniref:response regulator n=1 Tax=Pseudomonas sp. ITA TaxID=2825841 RepID=UPI00249758C5|nr:response regulator transcription factor [Pseudomonas sp. ITA]MDI2145894.1 response regulator transcription factor [Pseudomonas sp. ITA]